MTNTANTRASDAEPPMPHRESATRTGHLNRRNFAVGIAVGGLLVLAAKWREHK